MDKSSHTACLETDEIRILERREAVGLGIPYFKPHLSIFLPALLVSFLYLAFWAAVFITGSSSTWVAQLFIASLAIVLPLLFAAAFLRYQTVRVQLLDDVLIYHPGWPKDSAKELPISRITSIALNYGFLDKQLGSGDLIVTTDEDETVAFECLEGPGKLYSLIQTKLDNC